MTKYTFTKGPVSPAPRPFDLEQQMRQFMVEKRSAGHQQAPPLTPPHYNTHKQLPVPPSPSPPPSRKLLRLTSKSKRFMSPAAKRAGPEIRPVPPHPGRIRNHHPSASAPSLVSPGEMRQLQQRRPSSFIAPETPNDIFWPGIGSPGIYPKRPWRSPENSPLLPPPRGTTGRAIPPPIKISPSSSSPTPRKVTPVQLRNKTSEMFESVLSMYPHSKKQPPAARSNPDIAVLPNSSGITPRRITIDSVESTPRTPPPPPTPAKSRAQRERARPTQPPPAPAPSGYAAELVGSAVAPVEIGPVELMGDIEFPAPVIMAPVPQKRRRVKASAINSRVRQRPQAAPKPGTPEGREIYALMPLPEVPDTPVSIKPVSKSSPVLDVDFEGFNDGLVEWFNNFNWSESGDLLINTTAPAPAPEPTFNVGTRASVVDPDGAVVNPEPPAKPTMLSPKLPAETALLSPVYPVSPRLASYYGARASFASSVGDAFRFDGDEGCALSDVDEELDVDELYQEQFLDEGHGHGHGHGDLELEIEMILNGGGYDWRDGIYSAGSTSGSSVDVEEVIADYWMEEEEEGDILVGMVRGEAGEEGEEEGGLDWAALQGMWADDELHEAGHRPRTRYIAGRNSAIEGDVVFCLKSAERI